MANVIRIKRRVSGVAGAPAALKSAELAHNEVDNTIYVGKGDDGGGNATSVVPVAGSGAFANLTSPQTIGGAKTFSASPILPTPAGADNSTKAATTAFVKSQGFLTGNQVITLSGDITGSGSTAIAAVLANSGVTAGTYAKVTVDAKGRVTVGAALAASDVPSLTAAKISDFVAQVRAARLDEMAAPTAVVSMNAQRITGLADPTAQTDAVTKQYADALTSGLDYKESVRAATTANITLSGTQTVDSVALATGDRVLVKNQNTGSANGVYTVASGAWPRASDFNTSAKVSPGALAFIEEGGTNGGEQWVLTTTGAITLGTTALAFTQFGGGSTYAAGNGLQLTHSTFAAKTANAGRVAVSAAGIDLVSGVVVANTYKSVTVDTYGRVTGGSNPTTLAGYGITDAQAKHTKLTNFSVLAGGVDKLPYFSGADTLAQAAFTAFGRTLVATANAAAGRSALGLGSVATQAANAVAITGGTIDGVTLDGGTF